MSGLTGRMNYCIKFIFLEKNTKDFLINHSTYSENIQKDVRYNFSLFLNTVDAELKKLKNLMEGYGVDTQDVDYYFDCTGFDHLIRIPNG